MSTLDRAELATFLRSRRHRLNPTDVGLPGGGRRRTPGLRRQEVAELAGISIDYYIRLEQARGPQPSKQVLGSLSRALMLTADEREYLFRIAGEAPPETIGPNREVSRGIRNLLNTMVETPAYVVDASYNILAWNDIARYFIGDLSALAETDRNMIRWTFNRHPAKADTYWSEEDHVRFTRHTVGDLRAAYARYPGNPEIAALIAELQATSPMFREMWDQRDVSTRRAMVKHIDHPIAGTLEFECNVLHIPDSDQRLITYTAEPGSPTQQAFRDLAMREYAPHPTTDAYSSR